MKAISVSLLSLNALLWGTYYVVTKRALSAIDPLCFASLDVAATAPLAVLLICLTRNHLNRSSLRRGAILGVSLSAAVLGSTVALRYASATDTAFFPALNGLVVAIMSAAIFREHQRPAVWLSGSVSAVGALLILLESGAHGFLFGDFLALLAAFMYAVYIFVVDRQSPSGTGETWVVFGIELIVLALVSGGVAIIFGKWNLSAIRSEAGPIIYVGLATTFLPTAISLQFQRHVQPVVVAFLYALEPVWGAVLARYVLGEAIRGEIYFGGSLIVIGSFLVVAAEHRRTCGARNLSPPGQAESHFTSLV